MPHRQFYYGGYIFFVVCFSLCLYVTATTSTPPVTFMCFRASLQLLQMVPTTIGLAATGQDDRGSATTIHSKGHYDGSSGLATVLQQQQPQSQLPYQADYMPWVP